MRARKGFSAVSFGAGIRRTISSRVSSMPIPYKMQHRLFRTLFILQGSCMTTTQADTTKYHTDRQHRLPGSMHHMPLVDAKRQALVHCIFKLRQSTLQAAKQQYKTTLLHSCSCSIQSCPKASFPTGCCPCGLPTPTIIEQIGERRAARVTDTEVCACAVPA